ncbi:MAG: site-2 protease family protein [Actinobacteria bacterium]|nr:site-2 protease family protein [Actinomycetota bacterium]
MPLISIISIGFLIFFHELGHFAIAKLVGIKVQEFSLGFGPKLLKFQRGETLYSIRAFFAGGFVKMIGMDSSEELSDEDRKRAFYVQPVWKKIFVLAMGPLTNILLASFLFFSVFMIKGLPSYPSKVGNVEVNSPADKAGIKKGDLILKINDKKISDAGQVIEIIKKNPNKEVEIVVNRRGKIISLNPVLGKWKENLGFLGVGFGVVFKKAGIWKSLKYSFVVTYEVVYQILLFLKDFPKHFTVLLKGGNSGFSGPVGIYKITTKTASQGIIPLLSLLGYLSLSLGIFNLLPFPPLDGGHVIFAEIEAIRGKSISKNVLIFFQAIGITMLLILLALVTRSDLIHSIPNM